MVATTFIGSNVEQAQLPNSEMQLLVKCINKYNTRILVQVRYIVDRQLFAPDRNIPVYTVYNVLDRASGDAQIIVAAGSTEKTVMSYLYGMLAGLEYEKTIC